METDDPLGGAGQETSLEKGGEGGEETSVKEKGDNERGTIRNRYESESRKVGEITRLSGSSS